MSHFRDLFKLDRALISCPYDIYRIARDESAVIFEPELNVYIVTRYATIVEVNSRPSEFSSCNPMGPATTDAIRRIGEVLAGSPPSFRRRAITVLQRGRVLFTADPPEHTGHRRVLNSSLHAGSISDIEPLIQADCRRLCGTLSLDEPVDVIRDYCTPIPILALAHLLGVPSSMAPHFSEWAVAMNKNIGSEPSDQELLDTIQKEIEFWDYFEDILKRNKGVAKDNLISQIANSSGLGDQPLTLEEQVGLCSQLISAGSDTTTKLLAQCCLTLARDHVLAERLREAPELIPAFIEETLRLEPPVQGLFRVATANIEIEGVAIPAGSTLWCLYASGNRDTAVFSSPDQIDLDRPEGCRHLSFGTGPHACIGANLARSVARIALETLLEMVHSLKLEDSGFRPTYAPSYVMHGFPTLRLRLGRKLT